jgi:hypothetical protein
VGGEGLGQVGGAVVTAESAAPGHVAAVRRLVFDQMDGEQVVAFGQVFESILAGLENSGPA